MSFFLICSSTKTQITTNIYATVPYTTSDNSIKLHCNSITTLWVIFLTNKHANKHYQSHNFLCQGGNYCLHRNNVFIIVLPFHCPVFLKLFDGNIYPPLPFCVFSGNNHKLLASDVLMITKPVIRYFTNHKTCSLIIRPMWYLFYVSLSYVIYFLWY